MQAEYAFRPKRSVDRVSDRNSAPVAPTGTYQVSGLIAAQLRAWSSETAAKRGYVQLGMDPTTDDQQRSSRIRRVVRRRSRIARKTASFGRAARIGKSGVAPTNGGLCGWSCVTALCRSRTLGSTTPGRLWPSPGQLHDDGRVVAAVVDGGASILPCAAAPTDVDLVAIARNPRIGAELFNGRRPEESWRRCQDRGRLGDPPSRGHTFLAEP
jgi:hypothetical protein